jgi:hypothetical protein
MNRKAEAARIAAERESRVMNIVVFFFSFIAIAIVAYYKTQM